VTLTLKRGKFSRSSGQWQDEDYDVLADGKVVGRILETDCLHSDLIRPDLPKPSNCATLESYIWRFVHSWQL
jgi:hypothetical protein